MSLFTVSKFESLCAYLYTWHKRNFYSKRAVNINARVFIKNIYSQNGVFIKFYQLYCIYNHIV